MWMPLQDQGLGSGEGDAGSSTPVFHFAIVLLTLQKSEVQFLNQFSLLQARSFQTHVN